LSTAHLDFEKGLNAYAFLEVHSHSMSEDLVQDTFMKTWKYLVKGGKILLMKAFLYHILNDLIVDQYRKHKTSSLDALLEKGFDRDTDDSGRAVNFLDGKNAMLLIGSLPEKYQTVMRMRYTQDLSLSEMSLLTGQSKNSVAVQLHRGLEKLKIIYTRV
jgi:RNA polymerase sigma-70 factor (ECF subfamily)